MDLLKYLLPKPQLAEIIDVGFDAEQYAKDSIGTEMEAQEYELIVQDGKEYLIGGSDTAIFYANQTLAQLKKIYNNGIPDLYIHDWPEIQTRGYYYDITRGKVPTLKTLKELTDRLASYKYNQLQLYVEHTFAFEGFEEMWEGADPLTAKEIKELDEYCVSRHIELVPSLSTFGHLFHLLRTKKYSHLCELPDTENVPFNWPDRMSQHTIDVSNPESIEVIKELLDQYIPLFKTDKFNICCDETFDLGTGRSKKLCDDVGKGRLYIDFLIKIIAHVQSHNKTVMFWGDILLEHPEYINEIPKDVILLNWDYKTEPNEENIKKISKAGLPQYLCPGVWGWNNFVNGIKSGYENISKMAKFASKYKAIGLLNTDWGDFGNVNTLATSIPGMIMGGAFSWNTKETQNFDAIAKLISRLEYGDESETLVGKLNEISYFQTVNSSVWNNLVHYDYMRQIGSKHRWCSDELLQKTTEEIDAEIEKTKRLIAEVKEILKNSKTVNPNDDKEIRVAIRGTLITLKILRRIVARQNLGADKTAQGVESVSALAEEFLNDYSKVWLLRNKPSEINRIREIFLRLVD